MSQPLNALLATGADGSQPDRAYRLLIAQRLAEAVAAAHAAGGVIGNLDDQRVLVEPDGTVTFGDDAGGATGASAPAYTAPELQGTFTSNSRREAQRDLFALAVLLFQLLMEGKHPYAGQWVGGGDLPDIPKAIQLGLYAYGGSSVMPPPGAPALGTLEPGLADLFTRSFAPTSAIFRTRPTGAEWARALAAARQEGHAGQPAPAPSPGPTHLSVARADEPAATTAAAPPSPIASSVTPSPALQRPDRILAEPDPQAKPAAELEPPDSVPEPTAPAAPEPEPQAHPEMTVEAVPPDPAMLAQGDELPNPAALPGVSGRPRVRADASTVKRAVPRHVMPPRVITPRQISTYRPSGELLHLGESNKSWSTAWSDHVGDLLRSTQPGSSWSASSREFFGSLRYVMATWKLIIAVLGAFLLFLGLLTFVGREDPANPRARPAGSQATRVLATQTPVPRSVATRTVVRNPAVASFGSNFDVSDGVILSTGERFIASIRNLKLRLEAFGKGAHGKVMFNAAPAEGDFHFTMRVGSVTGQGELLMYVQEMEAPRTWVLAVDPAAETWGLSKESAGSSSLTPVTAPLSYHLITREPVRIITVARKGGRTSVMINGTIVSHSVAGTMPDFSGPVQIGIGAMIPEDPAHDGKSFVATVERVAMLADEG